MKARKFIFTAFILPVLLFAGISKISAAPGLGLGVCHSASSILNSQSSDVNWFYTFSQGDGQNWKDIEATAGVYNFSLFRQKLNEFFQTYPNSYIWLNITTAHPQVAPAWAKPTRADCPVGDLSCNPYGYIETGSVYSSFAPWNTKYQESLRNLITAVANNIKDPSFAYRSRIKGVIIMAGGYFGEMIVWHDPAGSGYQQWIDLGYSDDKYKQALTDVIVPIYSDAFSSLNYPLVIQMGSGLSGSGAFARSAVNDLYAKYPSLRGRIYFKYNSWRKVSWNGNQLVSSEVSKHNILRDASAYTLVGWEPGASPGQDDAGSLFSNMSQSINYTNASFFCLQSGFFNILSSAQIAQINSLLQANIGPTPTGLPPTNTPTPTNTITPSPTSPPATVTITPTVAPSANTPTASPTAPPNCDQQKLAGDYNCDQAVDSQDFEDWKSDYLAGQSTLSFFEYWRRSTY